MRAPYEWAGGTAHDHESLAWFSHVYSAQMGPRHSSFRDGVTLLAWARAIGLLVLVCLLLTALIVTVGPEGQRVGMVMTLWLATSGLYLLVMMVVALLARRYQHHVHAHGLVLSGPWGRTEVIPWATIDPGRTIIATTVRAMTRMPVALHRQRAVLPPGVVINGWTGRPTGSHEAFEAFSSGYRYQPQASDSPFGWWQLGVTDPEAFLRAVEAAMVADGYPAEGLAPFALSRRVTARDLRRHPELQRERLLTDPVIGLPRT